MKSAIYIEQQNKKTAGADCWVGYAYAQPLEDDSQLSFVKDSIDQRGKPVRVYRSDEHFYVDTPGGVVSSDLLVVFDAA